MALESIKNINIDCYDNRYILINAKQYDNCSRYISVTCYNQGSILNISHTKHTAYVRYRKADGRTVFNFCTITPRGQVEIELTEQMLAATGVCDVDLVIINKGNAVVDINTGKITTISNSQIISTMKFSIYVYESTVDNSLIESSDEYEGLVDLLNRAEAEYKEVIDASELWALTSQSWAIGGSDVEGRKEVEDTDNAKYYCRQASDRADTAKESQDAAKTSETNAKTSEVNAKTSETNAANSESAAKTSETNAKTSETNAKTSEQKAGTSEANAKTSETNAKLSEDAAELSETNAKTSETNSAKSEANAKVSEANAKTSETKTGEYCEQVKNIVDGLNSGFIPMGTVSFAELATVDKATGYVYNINEDFVTDETFKEGAGVSYTVGSNVYRTGDGFWDCFGGSASVTATVDEVKTYLGI